MRSSGMFQHVAQTPDGADTEARMVDLSSQAMDVRIDGGRSHVFIEGTDMLVDVFLGNHPARSKQQDFQQASLAAREIDCLVVQGHRPVGGVEGQGPNSMVFVRSPSRRRRKQRTRASNSTISKGFVM